MLRRSRRWDSDRRAPQRILGPPPIERRARRQRGPRRSPTTKTGSWAWNWRTRRHGGAKHHSFANRPRRFGCRSCDASVLAVRPSGTCVASN